MRKSLQTALLCLCFTDYDHFATPNGGIAHIRFPSTIQFTFSYVGFVVKLLAIYGNPHSCRY